METGTAILIERMKTHPEEFSDHPFTGKWIRVMETANACLPEEDKRALREAQDRMHIDQFNELVLRTLAGEVEQEETTALYVGEKYKTGWNDPRQMVLAKQAAAKQAAVNQALNNTITSGGGAYITRATLVGANGTSASDLLLQPSAFGAVPVSNYSSGES